jgi:hypothetical protein
MPYKGILNPILEKEKLSMDAPKRSPLKATLIKLLHAI